MKALVVGGTGHVGSHLVPQLCQGVIIVAALIGLNAAAPAAPVLTLAHDGASRAVVAVAQEAPACTKLAARELASYLGKITGAQLPVTEIPASLATLAAFREGRIAILVGDSRYTRELGLSADGLKPDGFTIECRPEALVILGRDDPALRPTAWSSIGGAGTLYGVYRFLERLGVRFYYPGEMGEVIPRVTTLALEAFRLTDAPYFSYRLLEPPLSTPEAALWLRKLGCGATRYPTATCHSFQSWATKYKAAHPEFFGLHGGKRGSDICFYAPGVREEMIAQARAWLAKTDPVMFPYFTVMHNDGAPGPCECPACQPRLHPEQGWYGIQSDYITQAAIEVAQAVHDQFPDRGVIIGAYNDYSRPPVGITQLPPNVAVCLFKHRQQMWSPEARDNLYRTVEGWAALKPKEICFWEYYNYDCWGKKWRGVPGVTTSLIVDDFRRLKEISQRTGVPFTGEMIFCDGRLKDHFADRLWWMGLDYYVTARCQWDPDLDRAALMEEFYAEFFGPAAAPMKQLYERAEEVWMTGDHGGRNLYCSPEATSLKELAAAGYIAASPWEKLFTPPILAELARYLTAAEAAAIAAPYRERVAMVRQGFTWTQAEATTR